MERVHAGKLLLPMPISVNCAYGNGKRGRYKMPAYKAWEELCMTYKNEKLRYEQEKGMGLVFSYKFYSNWFNKDGSVKRKDVSNYFKVLEDCLGNILIGFDDKFIFEYENVKKVQSDREEVEIEFKEIRI